MTGNVLVTGGAGYIGSHTLVELLSAGYTPVVLDNFSNSQPLVLKRVAEITGVMVDCIEGDVRDVNLIRAILEKYDFLGVIHFAGLKAVGESTRLPLLYHDNNVAGTVSLLKAMDAAGVRRLIFSSSATVYGMAAVSPIAEDSPLSAINPYGQTKLLCEMILRDLISAKSEKDSDWQVSVLRYFNPAGAHVSGLIGESPSGLPNNLMPYVSRVAGGTSEGVQVFGDDYDTSDGTGVRDYIHVQDLAAGHVSALKYLLEKQQSFTVNLGTGVGYSVLDVIRTYAKVSGRPIPYRVVERRAGDVAVCFADATRAESLMGWKASRGLETMCQDAWRWQEKNPTGYQQEMP